MTVSALQVGHNLFQEADLVRFMVGLSDVILQSVHRRHVTVVCVIVYIGHLSLWFSICLFLCMSACCLAYSLVILSIVTWVYLPFCQHVCLIDSLSLHAMDLKQACHTRPGHFLLLAVIVETETLFSVVSSWEQYLHRSCVSVSVCTARWFF